MILICCNLNVCKYCMAHFFLKFFLQDEKTNHKKKSMVNNQVSFTFFCLDAKVK